MADAIGRCWSLGADQGKGGKYLIFPPDYKGQAPQGYYVLRPDTYTGYALIRSNLKSHSDADITAAMIYEKRLKVYLLSQVANPPKTKLTDAKDGPEKAFFDKQWKLPDIEEAKW